MSANQHNSTFSIDNHGKLRLDWRNKEWYFAPRCCGHEVRGPQYLWILIAISFRRPHKPDMGNESIQQKFAAALEALVEEIKADRSILAAILCGSLSYDKVWSKSDIDLVLITIDDKKVEEGTVAMFADGVNVHAFLFSRKVFRQTVESSLHHSFMHSLLAKGRLLYTHDPSIADLCGRLQEIGERDTRLQLLSAACHALPSIYKAHKFFITRRDLDYTALWILYAATSLAKIEVVSARLLADREVIPQAMTLNPSFFKTIYADLLNSKKSTKNIQAALDAVDHYLGERASMLFAPVIDHLSEVSEARSCREIEDHFKRNYGLESVTTACEYLADQGLIGKASTPVRLTKMSNVEMQELAFFYIDAPPDTF
jgi:hypothetical protein